MPRSPEILDECIPVYCRKCKQYLATIMPKAEALCRSCSTPGRNVWTQAIKPKSATKNAIRKRLARQELRAAA